MLFWLHFTNFCTVALPSRLTEGCLEEGRHWSKSCKLFHLIPEILYACLFYKIKLNFLWKRTTKNNCFPFLYVHTNERWICVLVEAWISELKVRIEIKARTGSFPTGPKPGRITLVLWYRKKLYNTCHSLSVVSTDYFSLLYGHVLYARRSTFQVHLLLEEMTPA